ncbi:cell division protein FtsQ/DivIB [Fidelibacter multiformis]|jgi:cell division septal protein FtsQ|uniref:cell division protein FtsQ/DivIB n=1 Tax=Fidelibacter multiformis TaxID=3377529 RepID=UPI0037DCB4AD
MSSDKQKKVEIPYLMTLIVIIILASVSILYARFQNIFSLNKIIVSGNYELTEEEVIYIAGLTLGEDLLSIPVLEITERLEQEPYIRQALVYKRLPDGLVIQIRERIPILLMNMEEQYSVDNQGILLPAPRSNRDIPVLTGIPSLVVTEFGSTVLHPQIRQGVGMMSLIRKKYPEINILVQELHWDEKDHSWILRPGKGRTRIYVGNSDLKRKINILEAFIEQRELTPSHIQQLEKIDLRYDKQVIVKPKR